MPDFDSGQYFLTVLAPVDNRRPFGAGDNATSPVHALREALERMPTALQTPVTEAQPKNSPFARGTRIHFARFFIIDDVYFNGRPPVDTVWTTLRRKNVGVPGAVDQLATPWLAFVLDFDPDMHADEPRTFLESLWGETPELKDIFRHCWNFPENCRPGQFAEYMLKCRVETTMPFHDYWPGARAIAPIPAWWLAVPAAAALALTFGVAWLIHAAWYVTLPLAVFLIIAAEILFINWRGRTPFPAAPNTTLPEVLKALYLQQAMGAFVATYQNDSPAARHAAFGKFIEDHAPLDVTLKTQDAGVVRSTA